MASTLSIKHLNLQASQASSNRKHQSTPSSSGSSISRPKHSNTPLWANGDAICVEPQQADRAYFAELQPTAPDVETSR
jgi:hypothetical protein